MRQYLSDALLYSAKGRGRVPDAAFSADDLLQIANEEMETYLAPLLVSVQESYYETSIDFPVSTDPAATYRVPSRAVGNALKEIVFLDTGGAVVDVPRIDVTDLEHSTWGVIIESQQVTYINKIGRADIATLRMYYPFTPNLLCQAAEAAVVTDIVGKMVTLGVIPAAANPLPAPADGGAPGSMADVTSFDFIRSSPGFEVIAFDQAGTCAGSSLTLSSVPSGLSVGDYVAPAHYTPVPQAPTALHALLAQSIAAQLLDRLGQTEQAQAAFAKREAIKASVLPLMQNRIRGAPRSITARRGISKCIARW